MEGSKDIKLESGMSAAFLTLAIYLKEMLHSMKNSWDVSNVRFMKKTFCNARKFNQSLKSWDPTNLNKMDDVFLGADEFKMKIKTTKNWSYRIEAKKGKRKKKP